MKSNSYCPGFSRINVLLILLIIGFSGSTIWAQSADSTKRKTQFFPLPALSFAPETGFTFGLAAFTFADLAKGDRNARMSNFQLLAIYTTKSQLLIDSKWFIATKGESFLFSGRAFYHFFPDRNYGVGNDASAEVTLLDPEALETSTFNYLPFNTKRLHFAPVALKQIRPNLFAGLQFEYERLFDFSEDNVILQAPPDVLSLPITGPRTGLGINITYDDRKNAVNPLKGNFLQFQNWFFREGFGGDYRYTVYRLDARKYINTTAEHTLAIQLVADHRQSPEDRPIPFRGLARFGGADLTRGYFFGTYQSDKMLMFQTEYRLPILKFHERFPVFDGLGMVVFLAGGQVQPEWDAFEFGAFRLAGGAGIRFSLDREKRLNVGMDYGIAFDPTSGGDKRQTGFYFFMGETF